MAKNKTLEIVRAISRAVGEKGHDGALTDENEPVEIGLTREEGNPITDSRVMDGFSVNFSGNKLIVKYQAEYKMKEIKENSFETDIEEMIEKVVKFVKKEAKKHTSESISLSPVKDSFDVMVQSVSNVRSWVEARKSYTIGGLEDADPEKEDKIQKERNKELRNWIEKSKDAKRPSNEKIKAKDNEREELQELFNIGLFRK